MSPVECPAWPAPAGSRPGSCTLIFPTPCHVPPAPAGSWTAQPLCGSVRAGRLWNARPPTGCSRCGWPFPAATRPGAAHPLCQRCRGTADHFLVARAALRIRTAGRPAATARQARRPPRRAPASGATPGRGGAALLPLGDWDALVPVPLHWSRRWRRGFNQAEALAGVGGAIGVQRRCCAVSEPRRPSRRRRVAAPATSGEAFAVPRANVR